MKALDKPIIALVLIAPLIASGDTVAFWRFEEGTPDTPATETIFDSSVNGFHGTPIDGPTYRPTFAPSGTLALEFDGAADRIEIPDNPAFELTESLTLEAYIYIHSFQDLERSVIIFRGDWRGGLDPYQLVVRNDGKLQFTVTGIENNSSSVRSPDPLPLREMLHVAGTLDHSTGKIALFINGVEVRSQITTIRPIGPLTGAKPGIGIGCLQDTGPNLFHGLIDEVRISDTALEPGEFLPPVVKSNPNLSIDTAIVLRFTANAGKVYTIQESFDLETWVDLIPNIIGDGTEKKFFFELSTPRKFYRVKP